MSRPLPPMDPATVDDLTTRLRVIALDVLGERLRAMIVKGSAIKGDFIPHFSDFDVHLFAGEEAMRAPLTPLPEIALAFQEHFSMIDVPSYQVSQIQVMFIAASNPPEDWIPALPGTFRLVHGELPETLPVVTPELIREKAREGLAAIPGWIDTLVARMPDKPDDKLEDTVRLTGTILKAALYEAAIVLGTEPEQTWLARLAEVLDVVEPALMPARSATRYYARAWRWAEVRHDGPQLRAMFCDGITALEALAGVHPQ
jgi:hypothetical protein